MKMKTRQITVTAIMLAICIASQFFKNLSVYITGPVINAALILTVLYAGLACGIILSIITPVTAFFITGSPVMAAIPAMFPCIMAGNAILVLCVALLKGKLGSKAGFPVSIVIGSILKGLFMGVVISLIILPNMLPEKGTNVKGIAASVLTYPGSYCIDWRRVCIYYCSSIKKDFIRQAGLVA